MRVLIDGTTLSRKTDGLTQYTLSVVLELLQKSEDSYTLIHREKELPDNYVPLLRPYDNHLELEVVDVAPIGLKRDIQFARWYRKNKKRFDAFYEPSAQYPLGVTGGVYTVHDILYEEFPEKLGSHARIKKWYLHHVVKRGLKKAKNIVAVSEFTKKELCKYHGQIYEDKIHVVYEGYEHLLSVRLNGESEFVKSLIIRNAPYFLYIGSSRGHKNLRNLFLAYGKAAVDWKLIVIGRMDRLGEPDKELVDEINQGGARIIFTGWLDENQMYTLLSNASAFVFPSKSEGFGIPILEAYYFNVPLLCSDIPVFKEVAGDACIRFNPFSTDNMAVCLENFVRRTQEENKVLLAVQKERLSKYSWKVAAEEIYELLKH